MSLPPFFGTKRPIFRKSQIHTSVRNYEPNNFSLSSIKFKERDALNNVPSHSASTTDNAIFLTDYLHFL